MKATALRFAVILVAICAQSVLFPSLMFGGQGEWQAATVPHSPGNNSVISTNDILGMLKAGVSAEVVTAKVKGSRCQCDTSPAALQQLKATAVPDSVIVAMIEASAAPSTARPPTDIRKTKTVYLLNRSTDQRVFDHLEAKLKQWGRWTLVERQEDADLVLVFSEKGSYLGSVSTSSAVGSGTYASGTGTSIAIVSDQRFLIAVEPQTERQLVVISCERRAGAGYTAGVLINRMRKYIEKQEKAPSTLAP
jgi:hypothetical protein